MCRVSQSEDIKDDSMTRTELYSPPQGEFSAPAYVLGARYIRVKGKVKLLPWKKFL